MPFQPKNQAHLKHQSGYSPEHLVRFWATFGLEESETLQQAYELATGRSPIDKLEVSAWWREFAKAAIRRQVESQLTKSQEELTEVAGTDQNTANNLKALQAEAETEVERVTETETSLETHLASLPYLPPTVASPAQSTLSSSSNGGNSATTEPITITTVERTQTAPTLPLSLPSVTLAPTSAYPIPVSKRTKWCSAHDEGRGADRPLEEFSRDRYKADGLKSWCKACSSARFKAHYQQNAGEIKERVIANKARTRSSSSSSSKKLPKQ